MHNPMSPDMAVYHTGLVCSLSEVLMDMASDEGVSPVLFDLLALACDLNSTVYHSLTAAKEE